jgi:Tfp pilus assembly protein PilX
MTVLRAIALIVAMVVGFLAVGVFSGYVMNRISDAYCEDQNC